MHAALALILAAWSWVGPTPQIDVPDVDPLATTRGLELRLGDALDGWTIAARATVEDPMVRADLLAPDGSAVRREIVLEGETSEDRSRELASAIALIIEQYRPPYRPPDPPPPPPTPAPVGPEPITGHVDVQGRVGLGPPSAVDGDFGVGLSGGLWALDAHLQPLAQVTWSRGRAGDLTADIVRFGAGLAGGSALARGRLWLGGGANGQAFWVRGRDRASSTTWASSTELFAMLQVRGRYWVVGLRTGADITAPRIRVRGQSDQLRFGNLRWFAALSAGVRFP